MLRSFRNSDVRRLTVFACALLCATTAAGQRPFSRFYPLNETGIPVRVNALVQDAAGYIWAGTDAGLYRYNGDSFVLLPDTSIVPVTALCTSGAATWAGYKNGRICKVANSGLQTLRGSNMPSAAITGLYALTGTSLLASTEDGIFAIDPRGAAVMHRGNGLPDNFIYAVVPVSRERALVASDNGLSDVGFSGGRFSVRNLAAGRGLPDAILRVISPVPKTSLCWLGTQQGGVAIYDTKTGLVTVPDSRSKWLWGQVNDILPASPTQAWAVTEEGYLLSMTLSGRADLHIVAHHFPEKALNRLLLDKTGNLWCATDGELLKLSTAYAGYIPLREPYSLRKLNALACDMAGNLWLAQENQLLTVPAGDTTNAPRLLKTLPVTISSLFNDAENRLWIGTIGDGLWYKKAGSNEILRTDIEALKQENVLSIAGTSGCLWVAGLTGVREVSYPDKAGDQTLIRHHTRASGIGTDYVYQIYPDSRMRIWMATDGAGVSRYDKPSYENWGKSSGLGSEVAYSITEDAAGDIWAATLGQGLLRFHGGKWMLFGREKGQQDLNVSALSTTKSGLVIAVNSRGIDQWYPGSLQFRHYNRRLGVDIDSTSSVLNCISKDREGNVYVPFEHGVIVLRNDAASFDIRPKPRIAHVGLFMQRLNSERHNFRYDENYLTFYFDGLNYTNPERLNYRYKLEGFDDNWSQTMDEFVTFPNLSSGRYRLLLQASMSESFEGAAECSWSFIITPPFWKQSWFIVLATLLLGALVYLLIRLRDRRLNTMLKLRQERLAFEYEHLKSQVNPHFLFNSLNTLTGLIEGGSSEAATAYTEQLSDLYRNMLSYRNEDLILLSEEWAILSAYLHIQKSRFEDALQVVVDIPDSVLKTRRIIPMALQLLVENAIKHNVVSKRTPLTIEISADENEITICNVLNPKIRSEKGAGIGLENIRHRYELLTKKRVSYGKRTGRFIITLPLL